MSLYLSLKHCQKLSFAAAAAAVVAEVAVAVVATAAAAVGAATAVAAVAAAVVAAAAIVATAVVVVHYSNNLHLVGGVAAVYSCRRYALRCDDSALPGEGLYATTRSASLGRHPHGPGR